MKQKINSDWRFFLGDGPPEMAQKEFCDGDWRKLDLPHDWAIEGNFSIENYIDSVYEEKHLEARADSYLPRGCAWYRKELEIPALYEKQQLYLEFEGVFGESILYADGEKIGENLSGYAGKLFDLTRFAQGKERLKLALAVSADRMQGWWYEGAGIYRNVHRIVKPPLHLVPWGVAVTTPRISEAEAAVRITAEIRNPESGAITGTCTVRLRDDAGNEVAFQSSPVKLSAWEEQNAEFTLRLPRPKLWDIDTPTLYTAEVILESSAGTDRETIPFGVRSFSFTPDKGFFLNGRHLQLRGGNLHHDYAGLGTALPDRAHEKNVEVLKAMGANMIRSSHNPAAPALMEACDRLGMLLWAETRNLHPERGAEKDLTSLIRRDRNHPSVILWSLANTAGAVEGSDRLTVKLRTLHELAHKLDPSRPTAVGLEGNADANAGGFACVTDVVGYNGGGMGIDDRDHRLYPDRCMAVSEYASGRGTRGIYEETASLDAPEEVLGDGRVFRRGGSYCTEFALCNAHEREWEHIELRPYLAGGLMWSIIEYRGETNGWPVVTSQFGVLDLCRFPKDAYYYYLKKWTKKPMIHLFPHHWTRPGQEGKTVDLFAYTNCDYVTLTLNGEAIKGVSRHLQYGSSRPRLWWSVPYQPGTLVATGYIAGKEVCREILRTAGAPAQLRVTPDRSELRADGEDLSFLRIDLLDAAGTPVPGAAEQLEFSVCGAGRLRGLCSGDPAGHEPENGSTIRSFNGSALAIVQAGKTPGNIRVEIRGEKCPEIAVELLSRP